MLLTFLKGKLHRATVTAVELDYEGSISIDADLMKAAGILPYEQVDVYNIANGKRFTTYAVAAGGGSGVICVMGAAAHLVEKGDKIIIAAYCQMSAEQAEGHKPKTVLLNDKNTVKEISLGRSDKRGV